MSLGAVAGIKHQHPDWELTYSTWRMNVELLALNPHLDITCPGEYFVSSFDTWVDFRHESLMGQYPRTYWGKLHAMQCAEKGLLDLDKMESYQPQLYIGPDDVAIKESPKIATINVWSQNGLNWRLWSLDKWIVLVKILQRMGYKVVQLGGKDDPVVEGIDVNLCGKTRLAQSVAITAIADLAIGIDSFMMHCCHSQKYVRNVEENTIERIGDSTPSVLLAGPIHPNCVIPEGAKCIPVSYYPDCAGPCGQSFAKPEKPICEHQNSCMRELSVEQVVEAIGKVETNANPD